MAENLRNGGGGRMMNGDLPKRQLAPIGRTEMKDKPTSVRRRGGPDCSTRDPATRPARAAEVTLKLAHFLPPVAPAHAKLLKPWAEKVEGGVGRADQDPHLPVDAAGRRAAAAVRPGPRRRGRPRLDPARLHARAVPRLETFELPFVAAPTALVNAQAVQEFAASQLGDELSDVHLICAWAHDQGVIHSRKPITDSPASRA